MYMVQLQPICTKLEKLQDSFQSREEMMSQLETTATDARTSLDRLKIAEAEIQQLRSENDELAAKVPPRPRKCARHPLPPPPPFWALKLA